MKTVIFGFSDGSLQFSTSYIYLLSYDCTGDKYSINLVSTLCKLADKTKTAKILDTNDLEDLEKVQNLDTVPKREAHGLVLACNGAFTLTKLLKKLQLNLEAVYIFTDSISQILALDKSPSLFDPPLSRYYSQCNALLFQIGKMTDQRKEDMALFLEQKNYFNPANILSKYNIHQESVEEWMEMRQWFLDLVGSRHILEII